MSNKVNDTSSEKNPDHIWKEKNNYGEKFKIGKDNYIECYSKKQIKVLYPKNNYEIVGEYAEGSGKEPSGVFSYNDYDLNLSEYKKHSRIAYSEKGYVSVGEDSFVLLLKKVIAVRAISAVLCVMLLIAGVVFALNMPFSEELTSIDDENVAAGAVNQQKTELELEEGAVDWEGVKTENTGGVTAGIAIPGYKNITIKADTTDVNINFQNPEGNPCYFVISLLLDDGTVLYQSKMIEPGKGLYEIELLSTLEKGEYDATVKYETYSLEELTPLNGAEVKITLIAE